MGTYTDSFLTPGRSVQHGRGPIGNPLDCIADHHLAERQVCAEIDRIATRGPDTVNQERLADLIGFLSVDLPLHLQDEDEDLFPTMRVRCEPEDEIDHVVERLMAEHAHSGREMEKVVRLLRSLQPPGRTLTETEQSSLTDFAAHARRHLIVENAIVLPIGRVRLTDADLDRMRQSMTQRRQPHWRKENPNAG